jgi:phage shock protein E
VKNTFTTFALSGLILLAFIAGINFSKPSSCGAECEKVTVTLVPQEFNKQLSQKNVKLVDVRRPDEFALGHIEGSINLDIDDSEKFNKFLTSSDKDSKYLVYCRSGNRSLKAMKLMEEKGFTNIINLSGGVLSWQSEGLPLISE